MEPIILEDIVFEPDLETAMKRLRVRRGSGLEDDLVRLLDEARAIGRPKVLFGIAFIEGKGEDSVVVDGVEFRSRVLRVNLDQVNRVFPYVTTCGAELQTWGDGIDDILFHFWGEGIKEMALMAARDALHVALDARFQPGHTATMNPGSLPDWPITQQTPLFTLLGDTESLVGVHLTESMLMVPSKTVSGIRFATEATFESCQLCPRETCSNRRAVYDPALYDKKYAGKE